MAKMTIKGVDEYALKLSRMGDSVDQIGGKAIYAAAGIVADAIKVNLYALPTVTDQDNIKAYKNKSKSGLTQRQKAGLLQSFGISPAANDDGWINVKLGFDGYNAVRTKKYKKGQPNQLIARVVESGSSYMDKTPFIRPAVNATRKVAQQKMNEIIEEEYKKLMGAVGK